MNFRLLAKVIGLLLSLESVAMLGCGVYAWFSEGRRLEEGSQALLIASAVTVFCGVILVIIGRGRQERIPRREGVVIVGLGWVLCGLFGALPYWLFPQGLSATEGVFESISGFTTTGSTVIEDLSLWPAGLLLWRAVTQWLGGLGILVLFVAVLSAVGLGSKSLFRNESSFQIGETSAARVREIAVLLWRVYLVLTIVCIGGLRVLGMSWFDSVAHAFTTVSTGGFSPHNESIGYFMNWKTGPLIEIWLILFMSLCSVSFLIYAVILRRRWARLKREEEARWFFIFFFLATIAIVLICQIGQGWEGGLDRTREVFFNVMSISSTTGFGTIDYLEWPTAALLILAALMLLGGCSGSTAGGLKVSRLLVFIKAAYQEVVRAFRPNQVIGLQVNGNRLDDVARSQIVMFVAVIGFIVLFSSISVAVLELGTGIDLETVFGCVFATLGNIGPGFGEVGPKGNYSDLRPATQVFLCLLMVLGRLELYAVLVLFVPGSWKKY